MKIQQLIPFILGGTACFMLECSNSELSTDRTHENIDSIGASKVMIANCMTVTSTATSRIDFTVHILDTLQAKRERTDFLSGFKVRGSSGQLESFKNEVIDSVKHTAFCTLLKSCGEVCRTFSCKDTIPGVRFVYSLNSNNKVRLLYQPVCLNYEKDSANYLHFKPIEVNPSNYFVYDASRDVDRFQAASADDVDGISRYEKNIKIRSGKGYRNFKLGVDTRSTVFALYELGLLFSSNDDEFVQMYNAEVIDSLRQIRRHTIILEASKTLKLVGGYDRNYANLSHLCPPDCASLMFKRK
jgi:hypothetical protein